MIFEKKTRMYQSLKFLLKQLLPSEWLFRCEPTFRRIHSLFYYGHKFECPICAGRWFRFINNPPQLICPRCGSIARNRRLYNILIKNYLKKGTQVLDFSPSRALYRKLKTFPNINYFSTDFSNEFLADFKYDICKIESLSNRFDLIICFHILEHIENDALAMQELHRVLKPGGTCLIQTPYKNGDIYEDATIQRPTDRLKFFGQSDHVRLYSVNALKERLQLAGFSVEVKFFVEKKQNRFGLSTFETILVCQKK